MEDTWFEIPELAAAAIRGIAGASGKATYSAGPAFLEQTGNVASLWIAICNSDYNQRPRRDMEPVALEVASEGLRWLRDHQLAIAGTMIEVAFADASASGPFSSFNALETLSFSLTDSGDLSPVVADVSSETAEGFRRLRYWLSGRKAPE